MAIDYPMKPIVPSAYKGGSPSAVSDQSEQYKNMLGTQVASEDVGLFYQLNSDAISAEQAAAQDIGDYMKGDSRLFDNIVRYGNDSTPIESNSSYA